MARNQLILCAWCNKPFEKAKKRITQTEKLGQKHTCSRKCASNLTNEPKRCEPTTINAANTRRDKEKFPEKMYARYLVRQAIRLGKLIPLTECEICYEKDEIEAHHPDHSRPFLLLYLCTNCHRRADADPDKLEDLATDYSQRNSNIKCIEMNHHERKN
jgi:hypothetical protein